MEADWEFDLTADSPTIHALWPGFVDLRIDPARARTLPEAAALPALAAALQSLNAPQSPVWTSKCDFWPALAPGEFETGELDAPAGESAHASACYIDLLPAAEPWPDPSAAEHFCRQLCSRLHAVPLRASRADLIVRMAHVGAAGPSLGITAYLTAAGPTPEEAALVLASALSAFAHALQPNSTLQ